MSLPTALGLFTIVPVRSHDLSRDAARRAVPWLPLVGAGLGAVAALPLVAIARWAPHASAVGAVLAVGLLALLTRGLHLDGLADTADGLGSRASSDRALAIMKQSDIGPFGVVTLVVVLLADALALAAVPHGPWGACAALAVAAATGRLAVVLATSTPTARPDGFGSLVRGAVPAPVAIGLTTVVVLAGGLLAFAAGAAFWWWPLWQVVALAGAWTLRRHTTRRFGGTTGDVYGALVETATAITLVGLCLR